MNLRRISIAFSAFALFGCASVRAYDNAATATALDKAVVDAGEQMRLWRQELDHHRRIAGSVDSKPPPHWASIAGQGRALLRQLEHESSNLEASYKNLVAQRAEFSAFAHANPRIYSHEARWADAERWNDETVAAMTNFNSGLMSFTAAANQLNEFWGEHRLFQRHDVSELAEQIQRDTQTWREDYNRLVADFNQGQNQFNDWQMRQPNHWNAKADSALHPLRRMHHYLGDISKLIADLDKLKDQYYDAFAGLKEVDSLSPEWKRWSQMRARHQELNSDFKLTKERFQKAYEELVSSTTAKAPLSAGS